MAELKSSLQIPEQVKEMVEKAIEQAEQNVYRLIEAAEKSNLLRCTHLQEAANLQAQFLNAQFETASRQLKELYGAPMSRLQNLN
jgi:hypothetical protein